jgi:CDP-paratose 2-epimerase
MLLTGAAGFVGSTLALELRRTVPGLHITGLDNLSRKGSEGNVARLRAAGVEFVQGDIRDAALLGALPAVDWVIDGAANPSVLAGVDGQSSSFEVMDHNLIGTLRLLEYCKTHRAGFILLSTSRVYSIAALAALPVEEKDGAFRFRHEAGSGTPGVEGCTPAGVTEAFSTAPPLSLYGMSKLCSEQLALEYGAAFGFPVWINRCGVLAGAGQFGRADQGIFAYWIHAWRRKRPLKYIGFGGTGHQVRDALHPRDLAPLLVQQMQEPERPVERIQNVSGGAGQAMSLRQLSAWCAARFGPHAVEGDLRPRSYDIPWMVLDASRAHARWGWQPRTPLESILDEIAVHAEAHPDWLERSGAG